MGGRLEYWLGVYLRVLLIQFFRSDEYNIYEKLILILVVLLLLSLLLFLIIFFDLKHKLRNSDLFPPDKLEKSFLNFFVLILFIVKTVLFLLILFVL